MINKYYLTQNQADNTSISFWLYTDYEIQENQTNKDYEGTGFGSEAAMAPWLSKEDNHYY